MQIMDNIYIKDLITNEQSVGYWKYVIDGVITFQIIDF